MVKCGVLFKVRTEFLNIIYTGFGFKGLTLLCFRKRLWRGGGGIQTDLISLISFLKESGLKSVLWLQWHKFHTKFHENLFF
jgi:hypothetical protein